MTTLLRITAAILISTLPLDAQLNPVGPFVGQLSEGFETQPAQSNESCVVGRILEGQADVCGPASVSLVSSLRGPLPVAWNPHGGAWMLFSGLGVSITFDRPVRRFGGYFGGLGVSATFVDNSGSVVDTVQLVGDCNEFGCSWVWGGWEIDSDTPVQRIVLSALTATSGPLQLDDLEVDFGAAADPLVYCTSGTSAIGCRATLTASGTPSATAASGFALTAVGVSSSPIQGSFFHGAQGRQAQPWGNGTSFQCVVPPVTRGGLIDSSAFGAPFCGGFFQQDLNARWCPSCPKPAHNPGAGTTVQAQLWYRDPFNTSSQSTSLSNAIEFVVAP